MVNISIYILYARPIYSLEDFLILIIHKALNYIIFIISLFVLPVFVIFPLFSFFSPFLFPMLSLEDLILLSSNYNPMDLRTILNQPPGTGSPGPGPSGGESLVATPQTNSSSQNENISQNSPNSNQSNTIVTRLHPNYNNNDWALLADHIRALRQSAIDQRVSEGIASRTIYISDVSKHLSRDEKTMLRIYGDSLNKRWHGIQILGPRMDGDAAIDRISNTT